PPSPPLVESAPLLPHAAIPASESESDSARAPLNQSSCKRRWRCAKEELIMLSPYAQIVPRLMLRYFAGSSPRASADAVPLLAHHGARRGSSRRGALGRASARG